MLRRIARRPGVVLGGRARRAGAPDGRQPAVVRRRARRSGLHAEVAPRPRLRERRRGARCRSGSSTRAGGRACSPTRPTRRRTRSTRRWATDAWSTWPNVVVRPAPRLDSGRHDRDPRAAPPGPDVRRGRGRPAVALARDQARAVAGPHPGVHRAARRPAEGLSGDPPHRHQRQDLDLADGRHPAARPRPAHRAVHQPAPGEDDRAHLPRRRAARRRGAGARVQRRRAVHPSRRRVRAVPAVVLRDGRRDGVRRLRRRPGRRRRRRGRHGRHVGRHQRRRRHGRRRPADLGRPREVPGRVARRHRLREGRDHQARRDGGDRRADPRGGRGAAAAGRRGRRHRRARGPGVRSDLAGRRRRGPGGLVAGAARPLRRGVPAALRRPPGAERRRRARRRRGVWSATSRSRPTWCGRRSRR